MWVPFDKIVDLMSRVHVKSIRIRMSRMSKRFNELSRGKEGEGNSLKRNTQTLCQSYRTV